MNICLLQSNIIWGEPDQNLARAELMMAAHQGVDIFVLPEMFTTGFTSTPQTMADATALGWMQRMAAQHDAAVVGTACVADEGTYRNRMYFVLPDGSYQAYDKRHLFTYAGESAHYTAGTERVIVHWRNMRILLLVCYDLRFPVWSRCTGDYDMIIYVASWPTSRRVAWDVLLRARAIENQCYVVAVNRVGDDPACHYNGGSVVIDPYGKIIQACRDDVAEAVEAEVDREVVARFRLKFPALNDQDAFALT